MSTKENKLFSIIKAFFVPKEMVNLTRLPGILAFILVIVSALLCVFSSKLSTGELAAKQLNVPNMVNSLPDDFTLLYNDDDFPIIEFVRSDILGTAKASKNGIYHNTYIDNTDNNSNNYKSIDITFIIQDDIENLTSLNDLKGFDYVGYFNQLVSDNQQYLLYILTKDSLYYSYNLINSFNNNTNNINNENIKYFLPSSEEELVLNEYGLFDTKKWTKEVDKKDKIDFFIYNKEFTNTQIESIVPTTKTPDDVALVFNGYNFPNLILINYGVSKSNENNTFIEFHEGLINTFKEVFEARYNVLNFLMAIAIVLIFPPILSFITWIISRQFNLKRYKEYYIICSICFFDISIIALFLGFFMQYSAYAFVYLTITSIFYIISIIIINKDQMKFNPKIKKSNKREVPKETNKTPVEYSEIG